MKKSSEYEIANVWEPQAIHWDYRIGERGEKEIGRDEVWG